METCNDCGKDRSEVFKAHLGKCIICKEEYCVDCIESQNVRFCKECFIGRGCITIEHEAGTAKEVHEMLYKEMLVQAYTKASPLMGRLRQ